MTKARDLAYAGTALGAVSATELGYVDGVTSAIQTQIDGKQAINANVSTTELGYLDGVTSAVQTQLDAKTAKSTLTTTGDIYYASAANTPARLGIGSSAQVLTVAGGIPSWATPASGGGMTLLSTTDLSSSSTVTISNISQDYVNLFVVVTGIFQNSGTGGDCRLRFNGDTAGNYHTLTSQVVNNTFSGSYSNGDTYIRLTGLGPNTSYAQKSKAQFVIARYTTSDQKSLFTFAKGGNGGDYFYDALACDWNNTNAITSMSFTISSSTFGSGGTVYIYGVK